MMKNTSRQKNNKNQVGFSDKFQAYLHIHAHALFSSLGRLFRNAFSSVMTIIVMAIAISLAAGFYVLLLNLQQVTGGIESSNQISLFLKTSVSEKSGQQLSNKINSNEKVESVLLISKSQALKEFKEYSGFGNVLNVLDSNPLPTVIQVLPKNTLDDLLSVEKLMAEFERMPQVDFAQLDMQWVKRLQSMMQIMQRAGLLLAVLLGFAVLFITGNSIRLELQNRRDEVLVAKLVGATHSFIQRPFLYTGFWLGFGAGFVAWLMVTCMTLVLHGPVERLSIQYDRAFGITYIGVADTLVMIGLASLLGVFGAWIVLRHQLAQIKPE